MEFPVGKMCTVLEVSKSGYYKWLHRQPGKRALYNEHLTHEIKRVYHSSKRIYGSPRIAKELQLQGNGLNKQPIQNTITQWQKTN